MHPSPFRACLLVVTLIIATGFSANARVWHVAPDGTGDAPSVQAAIDSALSGDTVLLADGTHVGDGRHIDYLGKKITVCSESGLPGSCIIDMNGNFSLRFVSGEDTMSVLRGITIANSSGQSAVLGRYHSSPTFIDCDFSRTEGVYLYYSNATFIDCSFEGSYGGLLCQESSPRAYGCRFSGQTIESVRLFYAGYPIRPLFEDCVFSGYGGNGNALGGAIWTRSAMPVFVNCTFFNNAGGCISLIRDNGTISNCTFTANHAYQGGAIFAYNSQAGIFNCVFENNDAVDKGGAIYSEDSSCLIDSCTFDGNIAACGGAVASMSTGSIAVLHSVFSRNTAVENGAIIHARGRYLTFHGFYDTELDIVDCTLVGNVAPADGAAFYLRTALAYIENTIVAFTSGGAVLDCDSYSSINVSCSDLFGNAGGDWTGCVAGQEGVDGNISADPLFCDLEGGLYTLNDGSPCLPGEYPGNGCGLIGALGPGCELVTAQLDLLPGSCDNPFNLRWYERDGDDDAGDDALRDTYSVLPAALVGGAEFDVTQVDPASIRMEGIAPVRCAFEDVARPGASAGDCPCSDAGPDGVPDLALKFSRREIAVLCEDVSTGDRITLTVRGRMQDGTPFTAGDCLLIVNGIDDSPDGVTQVTLGPATPNPFNPATAIYFALPEAMRVNLSIYDVKGRRVATLLDETREAGGNSVHWDGRDARGEALASGIYFYRLKTEKEVFTRKIVLVK